MVKNKKGDRRERELVNKLSDDGFAVMRAPASGSAAPRELPDVLAGNTVQVHAIEVKSSNGNPIYIDEQEITNLNYFAHSFGARPHVGVRFDREDWYFFQPTELYRTPQGNYRVKKETALNNGTHYTDFIDHTPTRTSFTETTIQSLISHVQSPDVTDTSTISGDLSDSIPDSLGVRFSFTSSDGTQHTWNTELTDTTENK